MRSWQPAGAAKLDVPIIYAAMIDELFLSRKNSGLWSDMHFALAGEHQVRVAQCREMIPIFLQMVPDLLRRFGSDGVDEKKCCVFVITAAQFLNRWSIPICDWAIRPNEKEYNGLRLSHSKWIYRASIKVQDGFARTLGWCWQRVCKDKANQQEEEFPCTPFSSFFGRHAREYNTGYGTSFGEGLATCCP